MWSIQKWKDGRYGGSPQNSCFSDDVIISKVMMGKPRLELSEVVDTVTNTSNYLDILPFAYFVVRINHGHTRMQLGQESIF